MVPARPMKRLFLRCQRGEAIVESMISMLVLCLVIFGLMQIFYVSVAQMLTQYSSFKAARAASVGFEDYLVARVARTSVIGASGELITPPNTYPTLYSQARDEMFLISRYHSGVQYLRYAYWQGGTPSNASGYYDYSVGSTSFWINSSTGSGSQAIGSVGFKDFPLNFPMRKTFTAEESIDVSAQSSVFNSVSVFMD